MLCVIAQPRKKELMHKSSYLFLILFCTILFSCQKEKQKEIPKEEYWENIELITKSQKVTVYKFEDTASVEKKIYKKVSGEFISAVYKLEKVESKNFKMNKSERDSLYSYVIKLLTKPTFTDKAATDYAGYILIKLKDRNTTLMCEYQSVGEWSTISPETKKIYKLINPKVEMPK
jgi:hypothetical protein